GNVEYFNVPQVAAVMGDHVEGPEAFRLAVHRAVTRIPVSECLEVALNTHAVMVGVNDGVYLSKKLREDRGLTLLGGVFLALGEEEQVALILPYLAQVLLQTQDGSEMVDVSALPGPLLGNDPYAPGVKARVAAYNSARADIKIDAWKGRKAAEELARMWLE